MFHPVYPRVSSLTRHEAHRRGLMKGCEWQLRSDAHNYKESFHREDTDAEGRPVRRQVTPVDSKHDADAAGVTITLNPDYYNIQLVTRWPLTAWMLMGQTVLVKTH